VDDAELEQSLDLDDSFEVKQVLAQSDSGRTELVVSKDENYGLLVRKYIARELANPDAWSAASKVSCPQVPRVFSTYWLPDRFVVIYDYVEGVSVRELMREKGRLGLQEAASIAADVCLAASELHRQGVVHRDITPGNVIVNNRGAHLIDLGIARRYEQGARHDTTHLGTFGFAAPEQFGFAQTDARSDVYSIGSLLGFMLTGVAPSDPGFDAALEGVPEALRKVVEKARSFEPSARYAGATELAEKIQSAVPVSNMLEERGRSVRLARLAFRTTSGARRVAAIAFLVLGSALALVFLAAFFSLMRNPMEGTNLAAAVLELAIGAALFDVCGLQPFLVMVRAQPYVEGSARLKTYLHRCLMDVLLVIGLFIVITVVAMILMPSSWH